MNPFPVLGATLARNPLTVALFTGLIALAVALGIAISVQERALRQGSARAADRFDLIVAAPGSQTDILLSTVFLRAVAVELLPGPVAARVLADADAGFAAPISFGDSHGDSPVVGTTAEFVLHLSGGLAEGRAFQTMDEAVVGALVAAKVGEALEIRHGHADEAGEEDADAAAEALAEEDHDHAEGEDHDEDHDHAGDADAHPPVVVTGRMAPTGTPWDRAIVVPVEYVWAVHGLGSGHGFDDDSIGPPWDPALMPGLPAIVVHPESVAAAYGLRARYRTAESMAFFPAETLVELYAVMEGAVRVMSGLVLAAQVMVIAAILAGLAAVLDLQRRRFAVLRALGASRAYVFTVVWLYVGLMILAGAAIGLPLGLLASRLLTGLLSQASGVAMSVTLGPGEIALSAAVALIGLVLALFPALRIAFSPALPTGAADRG